MKTKIEFSDDEIFELCVVLNEHISRRFPVEEYVERRYAAHDERFRNEKIASLTERMRMLDRLRSRLRGDEVVVKVADLSGPALDWAVAKCEVWPMGIWYDEDEMPMVRDDEVPEYKPSSDWAQGGPIIQRENIGVTCIRLTGYTPDTWDARHPLRAFATGPTPLIAAMRCFVASKVGDEIGIPSDMDK